MLWISLVIVTLIAELLHSEYGSFWAIGFLVSVFLLVITAIVPMMCMWKRAWDLHFLEDESRRQHDADKSVTSRN